MKIKNKICAYPLHVRPTPYWFAPFNQSKELQLLAPSPLSLSPSFPPLLTILTTLNIYYIFSPFLLPLSPSFIMCVPCPLSSECARYLEARAGVRARIWERLGVCVGVLVCVYVYVGIC